MNVADLNLQNRECQLADYPNHKAACRINATMLERIRGEARKKEADQAGPSLDRKKVETRLKQWIQVRYLNIRDSRMLY
jgi:hypothetical protein